MRNLIKRPNLGRFLMALAAGIVAIAVYLVVESFRTVPATSAAADTSGKRSIRPREASLAILTRSGTEAETISAGMAMAIIDVLAAVETLDTVSASSSLQFRSLAQYERSGHILGVSYLLDWRLRYHPEDSRISASLHKPGVDEAAWELVREWSTDELESVPGFVAERILEELGLQADLNLLGLPPPDSKTYLDYLQARGAFKRPGSPDPERAMALLDRVTKEYPNWPEGQRLLADVLLQQAATSGDASLISRAREITAQLMERDPAWPQAFRIRSNIAHRVDWRWRLALVCARQALASAPGDVSALAAAADATFSLGDFDSSIRYSEHAIRVDPLVLNHRLRYARVLEYTGKTQPAIEAYRNVMTLAPELPGIQTAVGRVLVLAGKIQSATPFMEHESSLLWRMYGATMLTFASGDQDRGAELLQRFMDEHRNDAAYQIAELLAFADRPEEAFYWLLVAIDQHDPGVSGMIGNPVFAPLELMARWQEILTRAGHRPGSEEESCAGGTVDSPTRR